MNTEQTTIEAIAVFIPNKQSKISGTVVFRENLRYQTVQVIVDLDGLPPGDHGFHIHESGNLLDNCTACKAHFNPFNEIHGGPKSQYRHVGDLGNITADSTGKCQTKFSDKLISLRDPKRCIIGRSVVIHAGVDDLGKGNNNESLITGNAGSRIGCAVIGYKDAFYHL
jgi:Cu-Zn family superoxide dismutase